MAAPDMYGLAPNEIPHVATKASSSADDVLHGPILRREVNASTLRDFGSSSDDIPEHWPKRSSFTCRG